MKITQPKNTFLTSMPHQKGYAVLFAVVVASIISLIAIGLSNTTYKQLILSSLASDSQLAFYQSDAGSECALYVDNIVLHNVGDNINNLPSIMPCGKNADGSDIILKKNVTSGFSYEFHPFDQTIQTPCFDFTVSRISPPDTTVIVNGYNICDITNKRTVERSLKITY